MWKRVTGTGAALLCATAIDAAAATDNFGCFAASQCVARDSGTWSANYEYVTYRFGNTCSDGIYIHACIRRLGQPPSCDAFWLRGGETREFGTRDPEEPGIMQFNVVGSKRRDRATRCAARQPNWDDPFR